MIFNSQRIGIMQSRLSPLEGGKYQRFPEMWWENEFLLAQQYGFSHIEFIMDENPNNPLNIEDGYKAILPVILKTSVEVKSICADYFIDHPFWDMTEYKTNIRKMNKLIADAYRLGAKTIVLPLLENSSLYPDYIHRQKLFISNIRVCLDLANRYLINIAVESDLQPKDILTLLRKTNNDRLVACYDTGNCESLGYNINSNFLFYPGFIKHVHLKDCKLGSKNLEIGTGTVDFEKVFDHLKKFEYNGDITLQCARSETYDLDFIKKQFEAVKLMAERVYDGT